MKGKSVDIYMVFFSPAVMDVNSYSKFNVDSCEKKKNTVRAAFPAQSENGPRRGAY